MPFYNCAVCFYPLINSQRHTCGAKQCLDQWKEWGKFAPERQKKQKNLASMSPSERAHALSQGPDIEELEASASQRAILDAELEDYKQQQQKKHESPKFLRDMMNPDNMRHLIVETSKPKNEGGETNEASRTDPSTIRPTNPLEN